jgi:PhnB protein
MNESAKVIPEGYHSINPYLIVRNAAQAIEFYKKAFDAEERFPMQRPDGKSIMHAELKIGDLSLCYQKNLQK